MWKTLLLIGVILMLPVALLAGCSPSGTGERQAALGEEFRLATGETIVIKGEDLKIRFEAVTADSRCPTGAQCIWAGEAQCRMQFTHKGSASIVALTEPGLPGDRTQDTFGEYNLSFQLLPYPEVGKQPAAGSYYLLMTVTKSFSGVLRSTPF